MDLMQSLSDTYPSLDDEMYNQHMPYLRDELVFFYYCLSRNQNTQHFQNLYERLQHVLSLFRELQSQDLNVTYQGIFTLFYKMIAHTRDYFLGKGEHQSSYFLLWGWYDHYPELTEDAIRLFVHDIDSDTAGYGSWRDIKYLCEFLKIHSSQGDAHPLIDFCISLMNEQFAQDVHTWKFSTNAYCPDAISHVSKWIPREHKRFDWLFRRLAIHWTNMHSPCILKTAHASPHIHSYNKALLKCFRTYRKEIAALNKALQTLEVKLCARKYHEITPTSVPKFALARQRSFFLSSDQVTEDQSKMRAYNQIKTYHYTQHEDNCNLDIPSTCESSCSNALYACYSPGYFVKEARALLSGDAKDVQKHIRYLNQVWTKQTHDVSMFQLAGFLPIVDISSKMNLYNRDPLYQALGMAITLAFHQTGEFSKRILLVYHIPTWVSLATCEDFVSCVKVVFDTLDRLPSTTCNLHNVCTFLSSDLFQQTYLSSGYIKCLMFGYDSRIPLVADIHSLFSSQELVLPSFIFWNVYSDGSHEYDIHNLFHELLHEKSMLFLSGVSFYLLRTLQYICEDSTSQTLISSILKQSRLQSMESLCMSSFQ